MSVSDSGQARDKKVRFLAFWWADWFGSMSVRQMSALERCLYFEMLGLQAVNGSVPDDPARVARLLGLERSEVEQAWPTVRRHFDEHDGELANEKMAHERERSLAIIDKRAEAGRKSGEARRKRTSVRTRVRTSVAKTPPQNVNKCSNKLVQQPQDLTTSVPENQTPPTGVRGASAKPKPWGVAISELGLEGRGFERACETWAAYRRESKVRAYPARTWKSNLKKFEADPDAFAKAVAHSIEKGWQGIFEPKGPRGVVSGPTREERRAQVHREGRAFIDAIKNARARRAQA